MTAAPPRKKGNENSAHPRFPKRLVFFVLTPEIASVSRLDFFTLTSTCPPRPKTRAYRRMIP